MRFRTTPSTTTMLISLATVLGLSISGVAIGTSATAAPTPDQSLADGRHPGHSRHPTVRFATFNASLNRVTAGQLVSDLSTPDHQQARNVAEVLQRTRPDVVLLNEFDYTPGQRAVTLFREHYLSRSQQGARPIDYPYSFVAPSNTGISSGYDLDRNGTVGGGNDAFGFGDFEGQYGMVVLSRFPIDTQEVRTFQTFRWKDMPNALLPDDPATPEPADWYSPEVLDVLRLSSKSHWDVGVRIGRRTVHLLASHPTPPTFDGPEDRNGTRNHDEIRFWSEYVKSTGNRWIYDDRGRRGGLRADDRFVIVGDYNSDPRDGDSVPGAIDQLLDSRRIQDPRPKSAGAKEASRLQGGANAEHLGNPREDTADFADTPAPGNLRVDYVLPSRNLKVRDAAVYWPARRDPLSRLTGEFPFPTSDHRLVWVDVR